MTYKQPLALWLADFYGDMPTCEEDIKAAAELRRLHEVNAELIDVLNILASWNDGEVGSHMDEPYAAFMARAAIAKATGEQQ